jgi:hypothetical protein
MTRRLDPDDIAGRQTLLEALAARLAEARIERDLDRMTTLVCDAGHQLDRRRPAHNADDERRIADLEQELATVRAANVRIVRALQHPAADDTVVVPLRGGVS